MKLQSLITCWLDELPVRDIVLINET